MNYYSHTRALNRKKIEKHIIMDLGMWSVKIGMNENVPFKVVETPASLFLRPEILTQNSLNIFVPDSKNFRQRLHDFLHELFFTHLMEKPQNLEVFLGISSFVPEYMLNAVKDIIEKDFRAKQVVLCAAQTIPVMTSVGRSGVIVDFGHCNISFVPFFKGFVLKKHFHFFSRSTLQMLKVLNDSLFAMRENKDVLKTLSFDLKMKVLHGILVKFVDVPDIFEENEVLQNNNNSKMRINRRKYNLPHSPDLKLVITYLDSFRAGNFLFEGDNSLPIQFLTFFAQMPKSLAAYLVNNIIISGGLSHLKGCCHSLEIPNIFIYSDIHFNINIFSYSFLFLYSYIHSLILIFPFPLPHIFIITYIHVIPHSHISKNINLHFPTYPKSNPQAW